MQEMSFSNGLKQSLNGDEYYSSQNVVDMIVPYVVRSGFTSIWCPFDTAESNFVQTFTGLGFKVSHGHIETGQDFFNYSAPQGEIVVSNPPFSKRNAIIERLYEMDIPFALVMNFNGLFDSKKRVGLFKDNDVQILVPYGRMKFVHRDKGFLNCPNFQSVYVCNKLLEKQIEFSDFVF